MSDSIRQELLQVNQRLLDAIARADWDTYAGLCDSDLTCFEPEAAGQLVAGLEFHHFYFRLGSVEGEHNTTMAAPHVRVLGDVAVVCYVRLNQRVEADGTPVTRAFEETRIWHRRDDGAWRHAHFHRSAPSR
jgi:calcium/calmodulin-dependent protein kinase (CaM kinase) II